MKVALVVLADDEMHEGLGRVVNAMVATRELQEAGDEAKLIFDGGGTVWPGELTKDDHPAHELWEAVEGAVVGACSFCAEAFEATRGVEEAGVRLLDECRGHPSFGSLLEDGYQIVTF